MKPFRSICIFCLTAVALPHSVAAQNYTFTNIADTTGPFSTFTLFVGPRLNNNGTVSFTAGLDNGGSGVYRSDGVAITTIADDSGPNGGFGISDINDAGQVAYVARSNWLGQGIFRGDGLTVNTIIRLIELPANNAFFDEGQPITINNAGTVAFYAHLVVGQGAPFDAVFVGNGGSITLISNPGDGTDRAFNPKINNLGNVAFNYGITFPAERGIRLGNGGTISLVINDAGPYSGFGLPGLNDSNVVAVAAERDAGGWDVLKIDGATVDVVAGPFSNGPSVDDPSGVLDVGLNNAGDVAFLARVAAPNTFSILTGPDPVADKVIRDGDALFGSTATILKGVTSIDGPNDAGQIVFRYSLADGRSGIALATPILELAGDYNQNGTVDAADFTVWRDTIGQSGPGLAADGNCNDEVDAGDYDVWKSHFGETVGSGSGAAGAGATAGLPSSAFEGVPEPASLALLIIAATMVYIRLRRTPISVAAYGVR
jgi:hypothetical protein